MYTNQVNVDFSANNNCQAPPERESKDSYDQYARMYMLQQQAYQHRQDQYPMQHQIHQNQGSVMNEGFVDHQKRREVHAAEDALFKVPPPPPLQISLPQQQQEKVQFEVRGVDVQTKKKNANEVSKP